MKMCFLAASAGERDLPLSACVAAVLWSKTPAFPTNKAINRPAGRFQREQKAELGQQRQGAERGCELLEILLKTSML